MLEKLKFQFSLGNYWNVIKIASSLIEQEDFKSDYTVLMYKAASYANVLEDEKAIATYNTIIQLHPENVEPKIRIALIQIAIGEFEQARHHLTQAWKLDPENLDVLNNLIYISEQLHEFDIVIELSSTAIEIDPQDPSVWLVRAAAYEKKRLYELAIKDGLKAISVCEDDIYLQMAYNDLGYTYSKKGDLVNAESYLRKAIEVDETDPIQYNNLGWVLAEIGKIDEGLDYINYSIQLDSSNSYAYKNRAKVLLKKGANKKAKKDLLKAKAMDYHIEYDNEVNDLLSTL
ncbi:MAG: tetratricopeptide repeat protein [Saprospiraceae bacterium]|nr:tetratricopeptide repeat protein [Saprospiraceae bacterium]